MHQPVDLAAHLNQTVERGHPADFPVVSRHPKFPRRWHLKVPTLGWG